MTLPRNRALLLALAGIAILFVVNDVAYQPTSAIDGKAGPVRFSAPAASALLKELVGNDVPHPVGSAANALVRDAILKQLRSLGYSPTLQTGLGCDGDGACGFVVNIVARLEDSAPPRDAVLLAAHYDSVPAGPGASDDGVGVAALLEIARLLKLEPAPRHPIVLLISDGEEAGLLGASLFVREHPWAGGIKAAVNMDARGNSGPSLMFETGSANSWLIRLYGAATLHPITNSIFYSIYKMLPNGTDFTAFKTANYQGINLAFVGGVGVYHTPLDTWANVSLDTLQHQGDNAFSSLEALANAQPLEMPAAESVFFDVLGRGVIAWPISAATPVAMVLFLAWIAEVVVLFAKGTLTARPALWSVLGVVMHIFAGVAVCGLLLLVLQVVDRLPPLDGYSWIAHPLPMQVACTAIAFMTAAIAANLLAKRVTFWSLWFAATLLMNVLTIVFSIALPGTTFIVALTVAAGAAAALPACIAVARGRGPPPTTIDLASLLPVLIFFATLIPSVLLLYDALGARAWPITTLLVSLGTALLLPLLATARRVRRQLIAVSALSVMIGLSITVLLETYSLQWPQRFNFEYWLDADNQQAHWLAQPDSMYLPRSVRAAASFDLTPHPRYAGSGSLGFFAPAAPRPLAAPELKLVASAAVVPESAVKPTLTRYELHLQSFRGATSAFLVFPMIARVHSIDVSGPNGVIHSRLRELASGATRFSIDAMPSAGLDFSVDAPADQPLNVAVYDRSFDLPAGSIIQLSRPWNATSSQDGDVTIVQRTASFDPAAGR